MLPVLFFIPLGWSGPFFDPGYHPEKTSASIYYGLNYWMGYGHCVWMHPTSYKDKEISVGVMFSRDIISTDKLNTREKFLSFLEANHKPVFDLVQSGQPSEVSQNKNIYYGCNTLFSENGWFVIGKSAYGVDPFYSTYTSIVAMQIDQVTEIIRLSVEKSPSVAESVSSYNLFHKSLSRYLRSISQKRIKQIGNASAMSWRIYLDYMFWYGVIQMMFVGKWHLEPAFIKRSVGLMNSQVRFSHQVYRLFSKVIKKGNNIGFLSPLNSRQLIGTYNPMMIFDAFLENVIFERCRVNVFKGISSTLFYQSLYIAKLAFKTQGIFFIINPITYFGIALLLSRSMYYRFKASWFGLVRRFTSSNNSKVHKMRKEFRDYKFKRENIPWSEGPVDDSTKSIPKTPEYENGV